MTVTRLSAGKNLGGALRTAPDNDCEASVGAKRTGSILFAFAEIILSLKSFDPSTGIYKLLLAGKKRVAF